MLIARRGRCAFVRRAGSLSLWRAVGSSARQFDGDIVVDRINTGSTKWDYYGESHPLVSSKKAKYEKVIPMWVADMDFECPPCAKRAVNERMKHGVFGYLSRPYQSQVAEVVAASLKAHHKWDVKPEWIVWLPGLVVGLNLVAKCVGETGDSIMTCTPIYPPFMTAPRNQDRKSVTVPFKLEEDEYTFDFERMEEVAKQNPNLRAFFLCNPQNPTGRVFRTEELLALADFCCRHNLVLCSDEIHCDLVYNSSSGDGSDNVHIPIATLDPATADRTITLLAPSKTYNVPAMGVSLAVVSNPTLRRQLVRARKGLIADVNAMGMAATRELYAGTMEQVTYLRGNRDLVENFVQEHLSPGSELSMAHAPMQATYLAWIDAKYMIEQHGVADPHAFFVTEAGVGLSNGRDFFADPSHDDAQGFVRMNFGCPRSRLQEALGRLKAALETLRAHPHHGV